MQYDGIVVWLEKNLPYEVDEKILLHTTKSLENIIGKILLNNVSLIFTNQIFVSWVWGVEREELPGRA